MSGDSQLEHRIRLRGPWDFRVIARTVLVAAGESVLDTGMLPPAGKMVMPADWGATLGADFFGKVEYARAFHRPTGLAPEQRVELVIDDVDAWAVVSLNEVELGRASDATPRPLRFDVTHGLQPRNQLTVLVERPRETAVWRLSRGERQGLPGGLIGEVRLEIFSTPSKTTAVPHDKTGIA